MPIRLPRVFAFIALFALSSEAALACSGDKVLFEEKFDTADPAWGAQSDMFKVGSGKATIRAAKGTGQFYWNRAFVFDNIDVCYTTTLTDKTADPTNSFGGLMFWVIDNQNFYVLNTASNGNYQIGRRVDGQWIADPIPWTVTDTLKQGANQANKIRLKLDGQQITIEINDKKAVQFRAQAPTRPSSIGFFAQSSGNSVDPWAFSDLKITNIK